MTKRDVLSYLKKRGSFTVIEQMKHFGIESPKAFGNKTSDIRTLQKKIGTDHELALLLWKTGYYEARIVSALIADPDAMTSRLLNSWAGDFDSWAVCDTCCVELFCYTIHAVPKIFQWSTHTDEFVKRAGFVLIPALAIHRRELDDDLFRSFFPLIVRESTDGRNFVRKAVNWALRSIGKKNPVLHTEALSIARQLSRRPNPVARWIGSDAIKDLQSEPTQRRFERMKEKKNK
ncbi:MAG: DNA alkylation repair protein [Bacteroidota bacterium]